MTNSKNNQPLTTHQWGKQTEAEKSNDLILICHRNSNNTTSYLQECNEEKEGVGCPPELWVEEPGEEGEDIVFGCAENRIEQQTRWQSEERRTQERNKMVSYQNLVNNFSNKIIISCNLWVSTLQGPLCCRHRWVCLCLCVRQMNSRDQWTQWS